MNLRKSVDMYTPRPAQPLLPHAFVDNTMPARNWDLFQRPSWMRLQRPDPMRNYEGGEMLPALLRRQAT